jgi:hypothetical protein
MNAPYIREWREYAANREFEAREAYYEALNRCPRCCGCGDHGIDECGERYICYACNGTGNYYIEVA